MKCSTCGQEKPQGEYYRRARQCNFPKANRQLIVMHPDERFSIGYGPRTHTVFHSDRWLYAYELLGDMI